ncbi:hypothetical protein B9J93_09780 [Vibrio sp. V17_P4S1T151]|uniref:hypothetical protein n=1 Tax=unclassified Vibrio TaxID=2614977 RepID=UPI000B8E3758|nr:MULTISPECIES: hypothetical protein [unclassified Vibrio]OXX46077.1 hypothetical protein B9J93_09780 [Vibrio sp. V17_P4S1T151]OXX64977.1 hypothetical protein B9J89_03615 [Vibrio sp. V15_P4S5T153]
MSNQDTSKIKRWSQEEIDQALKKTMGGSSFFSIFRILYKMLAPSIARLLNPKIILSGVNQAQNNTVKEKTETAISRPYDYDGQK